MATKVKKTGPPAKRPYCGDFSKDKRRNSSPGPKPSLTVDQVAQAAIAIADAEGLDAVSMQRVAGEVQVTTMALYRYVTSKAELVAIMTDAAGGPVPDLGEGTRRWRSRLREWTRRCSTIYTNHPWFLQATVVPHRVMGRNELGWFDAALSALADAGLTGRDQLEAFLVLIGHVRSNAEFRAIGARRSPSDESWVAATTTMLGTNRDRYPALAALDLRAFNHSQEDGLSFGLECILDGIESLSRKRCVSARNH